jgi:hypothetical protein
VDKWPLWLKSLLIELFTWLIDELAVKEAIHVGTTGKNE